MDWSRTVITRKPCRCWGCSRVMSAGTRMRKTATTENGCFQHYAWCQTCDDYWSKYLDGDDRFCEGDMRGEDHSGWEAMRLAVEGPVEPLSDSVDQTHQDAPKTPQA